MLRRVSLSPRRLSGDFRLLANKIDQFVDAVSAAAAVGISNSVYSAGLRRLYSRYGPQGPCFAISDANNIEDTVKCSGKRPRSPCRSRSGMFSRPLLPRPRYRIGYESEWGAQFKDWASSHPAVHMHYMPLVSSRYGWTDQVRKWLDVIAAWPVRTSLIATVHELTEMLASLHLDRCAGPVILLETSPVAEALPAPKPGRRRS